MPSRSVPGSKSGVALGPPVGAKRLGVTNATPPGLRKYSTSFNEDETHLSEGGAWTTGNDTDQTPCDAASAKGGIAYGTQIGTEADGGNFNDSQAYLTQTYNDNQRASVIVKKTGSGITGGAFQEVEILLRCSVGAERTGLAFGNTHMSCYECNLAYDGSYTQIGRLKETPALFDSLVSGSPITTLGVQDGDEFSAEIVGTTITTWLTRNGQKTQIGQGTDTTGTPFTGGSPGIGFFLQNNGGTTSAQDFCLTSFKASEVTIDVGAHGKKSANTAVTTLTSATTTTAASGSSFLVAVGWTNAADDLTSVTDSKGNTYVRLRGIVSSGLGYFAALYYCENGTGGSSHTFTANFSPGVDAPTLFYVEVPSGVLSGLVDAFPEGLFSSVSPYTSNVSATTTQPDELVLAFVFTGSSSGTEAVTWGNSFLQLDEESDANNFLTGASAKRTVVEIDQFQSSLTSSGAGTTNAISFVVTLKANIAYSGTATAAAQSFAASASGAETFTGAASAAEQSFAASSSGLETFTGTATAAEQSLAADASGTTDVGAITGSGSAAISSFAAGASGLETFTGTASAAESTFAATGSGTEVFSGSASAAEQSFAATASGSETISASGAAATQSFAASASGAEIFSGTASAVEQSFAASASGTETFTGTASAAEQPFAATSSGLETFTGSGSAAEQPFGAASVGGVGDVIFGSGTASVQSFAANATALETFTGSALATVSSFACSAAAIESFIGAGSASCSSFATDASGNTPTSITGAASVSIAAFACTILGSVAGTSSEPTPVERRINVNGESRLVAINEIVRGVAVSHDNRKIVI